MKWRLAPACHEDNFIEYVEGVVGRGWELNWRVGMVCETGVCKYTVKRDGVMDGRRDRWNEEMKNIKFSYYMIVINIDDDDGETDEDN